MPCNTITTNSINLSRANSDLLTDALKAEKWYIVDSDQNLINAYRGNAVLSWQSGNGLTVRASNSQSIIEQTTQAYSKQAITWASNRAGWSVKSTGRNTLTVQRR